MKQLLAVHWLGWSTPRVTQGWNKNTSTTSIQGYRHSLYFPPLGGYISSVPSELMLTAAYGLVAYIPIGMNISFSLQIRQVYILGQDNLLDQHAAYGSYLITFQSQSVRTSTHRYSYLSVRAQFLFIVYRGSNPNVIYILYYLQIFQTYII